MLEAEGRSIEHPTLQAVMAATRHDPKVETTRTVAGWVWPTTGRQNPRSLGETAPASVSRNRWISAQSNPLVIAPNTRWLTPSA
jgi:hypothetical protein